MKCPAAIVLEWPEMSINRGPDARPSVRVQEKRREPVILDGYDAPKAAAALAARNIPVILDSVLELPLREDDPASLAVWTGDPLQVTSNLVALYHNGVSLDLSDRHKRLWERYRNRPKPEKAATGK